jgi:hypothetical protein
MKQSTLERLMIDKALGGLEPDFEELLDAFLAQNPQSASADYERIAADAGTALAGFAAEANPALAAMTPLHKASTRVWRKRSRQLLKYAACFVIGLTTATLIYRGESTETRAPERQKPVFSSINRTRSGQDSSFWSLDHIVAARRRDIKTEEQSL